MQNVHRIQIYKKKKHFHSVVCTQTHTNTHKAEFFRMENGKFRFIAYEQARMCIHTKPESYSHVITSACIVNGANFWRTKNNSMLCSTALLTCFAQLLCSDVFADFKMKPLTVIE